MQSLKPGWKMVKFGDIAQNTDVLHGMQIPKPSFAKQEKAVAIFETFRAKLAEIAEHIASSQQMLHHLKNAQIGVALV